MRRRVHEISMSEAVSYGFSMVGYFLATTALTVILIIIATYVVAPSGSSFSIFISLVLTCTAIVFGVSAYYGAFYKLLSDSVMRGSIGADSIEHKSKPSSPPRPPKSPTPPPMNPPSPSLTRPENLVCDCGFNDPDPQVMIEHAKYCRWSKSGAGLQSD